MEKYENAEMELIAFSVEDVIATSEDELETPEIPIG